MKTFLDFQTEVKADKIRNVYFIAASDNHFLSKACELLREKIMGSKDEKSNFFIKYADDTSLQEVFDLSSNFASLFSTRKILVIKRCEKYSRKLPELFEFAGKPVDETFLLLVFDKDYVIEKKYGKDHEFYDFSDLPQRTLYEWVREEFRKRELEIDNPSLELFISGLPQSFDLIAAEIEKISNYEFEEGARVITKELILEFSGYDIEHTPEELLTNILKKDHNKAFNILDNLLNSKNLNEVYLLSIISNYYMDLISFKTKGLDKLDSRSLYSKYKLWGERVKFAQNYHKLLNIQSLESSIERITDTDKKLKTSMLNSKILMTSLVEELINA